MAETSVYTSLLLQYTERRFSRTFAEIAAMDVEVRALLNRFDSARVKGHRIACYNLRVRISITEGVRFMFVLYSKQLASQISLLRRQLYNQVVVMYNGIGDHNDFDSLYHSLEYLEDDYDDDDDSFGSSPDEMDVEEALA